MYNRYIPQPDGSYRRSRIQDFQPQPRKVPTVSPPEPPQHDQSCGENTPLPRDCSPPPKSVPPCRNGCRAHPGHRRHQPERPEPCTQPPSGSVGSFLKNILPKDFDTGDLLIVLLLLLMAGDCREDQNNAILTLALYLFL